MRDGDVQIRRLPFLSELGNVNQKNVFKVGINEILGCDVVKLNNPEIMGLLHGKYASISGAGGSIGSEFVLQIY